jgi:hypothetical protein
MSICFLSRSFFIPVLLCLIFPLCAMESDSAACALSPDARLWRDVAIVQHIVQNWQMLEQQACSEGKVEAVAFFQSQRESLQNCLVQQASELDVANVLGMVKLTLQAAQEAVDQELRKGVIEKARSMLRILPQKLSGSALCDKWYAIFDASCLERIGQEQAGLCQLGQWEAPAGQQIFANAPGLPNSESAAAQQQAQAMPAAIAVPGFMLARFQPPPAPIQTHFASAGQGESFPAYACVSSPGQLSGYVQITPQYTSPESFSGCQSPGVSGRPFYAHGSWQ